MKLDCFLSPHKINSKRTDDLILKHEIRKYIEENTDTKLTDLGLSEDFINLTSTAREVKAKITEWNYIKLKASVHQKKPSTKGQQQNRGRHCR